MELFMWQYDKHCCDISLRWAFTSQQRKEQKVYKRICSTSFQGIETKYHKNQQLLLLRFCSLKSDFNERTKQNASLYKSAVPKLFLIWNGGTVYLFTQYLLNQETLCRCWNFVFKWYLAFFTVTHSSLQNWGFKINARSNLLKVFYCWRKRIRFTLHNSIAHYYTHIELYECGTTTNLL